MYRPRPYIEDDSAALHGLIRARVFATLAAAQEGGVLLAYAPVVLDGGGLGRLRFHLARANPMAALGDGARLAVSFAGPDAYVSPDWYAGAGYVPTWNYIAVEGEGAVQRLSREETRALIEDLSAQEERKLAPKPQWTLDKLPADKIEALLDAIVGFALPFERLEGKFKLSQDKPAPSRAGVIAALERRGDAASRAVAQAMRQAK